MDASGLVLLVGVLQQFRAGGVRGLLEDLVLVFDEKGFEILLLQLVHLVLFLLVHGGLEGELSAVGVN